MRNLIIIILLFCFGSLIAQPENQASKKEKDLYENALNYIDEELYEFAERDYMKLIAIDSNNFGYYYELGMLYFFQMDRKFTAIKYLTLASKHMKNSSDANVFLYLGQAYQYVQQYDKALDFYNKYDKLPLKEGQMKVSIQPYLERCNYAKKEEEQQKKNMRFRTINLGAPINSPFSEYASIQLYEDSTILFTSRRSQETDTMAMMFDQYWEYMYFSKKSVGSLSDKEGNFQEPVNFKTISKYANFGKKSWHKAVVSIYPDYSRLIVYQKQKLWTSCFNNGIWMKPVALPKAINFGEYQRHASITADGKTMYFSAYPTGADHFDIFVSRLSDDGKWSIAESIGNVINTEGDEDSPEITPDGKTLYFSSNGHKGMGGYDVFKSDFENGTWTDPRNMGFPINSPADDIFFKRNMQLGVSYLSSSRAGGLGKMDIYAVYPVVHKPDFKNCTRLTDNIEWFNIDFSFRDSSFVGKEVKFDATLFKTGGSTDRHFFWNFGEGSESTDTIATSHTYNTPGKYTVTLQVQAWNDSLAEEVDFCIDKPITIISTDAFALKQDSINKANQNKLNASKIELKPIYFDFNKNAIRPDALATLQSNIRILNENPTVTFSIHAHTDCRGPAEYNVVLSQRRADSILQYMVNNGVKRDRVTEIKGHGEAQPVNRCVDGVSCSNQEHELNRRVEFLINNR